MKPIEAYLMWGVLLILSLILIVEQRQEDVPTAQLCESTTSYEAVEYEDGHGNRICYIYTYSTVTGSPKVVQVFVMRE